MFPGVRLAGVAVYLLRKKDFLLKEVILVINLLIPVRMRFFTYERVAGSFIEALCGYRHNALRRGAERANLT